MGLSGQEKFYKKFANERTQVPRLIPPGAYGSRPKPRPIPYGEFPAAPAPSAQVPAPPSASKNSRSKRTKKTQPQKRKVFKGKRGGLYVLKYKKDKLTGRNIAYKSYLK